MQVDDVVKMIRNSVAAVVLTGGLLGVGLGQQAAAPAKDTPDAGDVAPPFKLEGSDGKPHSLAAYAGKKAVVIAWFPKAFTGG